MTTQTDVLTAQLAVLQNQKAGIALQATAQEAQLDLRISQLQTQIATASTEGQQ